MPITRTELNSNDTSMTAYAQLHILLLFDRFCVYCHYLSVMTLRQCHFSAVNSIIDQQNMYDQLSAMHPIKSNGSCVLKIVNP